MVISSFLRQPLGGSWVVAHICLCRLLEVSVEPKIRENKGKNVSRTRKTKSEHRHGIKADTVLCKHVTYLLRSRACSIAVSRSCLYCRPTTPPVSTHSRESKSEKHMGQKNTCEFKQRFPLHPSLLWTILLIWLLVPAGRRYSDFSIAEK